MIMTRGGNVLPGKRRDTLQTLTDSGPLQRISHIRILFGARKARDAISW